MLGWIISYFSYFPGIFKVVKPCANINSLISKLHRKLRLEITQIFFLHLLNRSICFDKGILLPNIYSLKKLKNVAFFRYYLITQRSSCTATSNRYKSTVLYHVIGLRIVPFTSFCLI